MKIALYLVRIKYENIKKEILNLNELYYQVKIGKTLKVLTSALHKELFKQKLKNYEGNEEYQLEILRKQEKFIKEFKALRINNTIILTDANIKIINAIGICINIKETFIEKTLEKKSIKYIKKNNEFLIDFEDYSFKLKISNKIIFETNEIDSKILFEKVIISFFQKILEEY